MDPDPSLSYIGIGLCLLILAFTSAVDAALTAISRHRVHTLQNEQAPRARILVRLLNDPYRFKAAVLFLNTATLIAATSCTLFATRGMMFWWRVVALVVLLLAALILSEAIPKALATRNPTRTALLLSGPMALFAAVLRPIIGAINFFVRPIVRAINGDATLRAPLVTEEELRLLVNVGEEEGLIEPDEREMIEGIFSFGDTLVREVMIPRVDLVALESDDTLEHALDIAIKHGYSRIPVYTETMERLDGMLYVKDLLPLLREGRRDVPLLSVVRQAYFVPEAMKVSALLKDLQQRKMRIAMVVDEYGGTAGLVTLEDVLEEIVGEIHDEYDAEQAALQRVNDTEVLADARVLLDDINDMTGLALASDESDRLGGLVYERLGRVPQVGDLVAIDERVQIEVLTVEGVGSRKLRITYAPEPVLAEDGREDGADGSRTL